MVFSSTIEDDDFDLAVMGIPCPIYSALNIKTHRTDYNPLTEQLDRLFGYDDLSTFESSLFVQLNYVLCVYSVTLLEWLGSIAIQVFQHSEHTSAQSVLAISNKPETQLLNKCIAASLQLQLNWTNQQTFGKPCCKL